MAKSTVTNGNLMTHGSKIQFHTIHISITVQTIQATLMRSRGVSLEKDTIKDSVRVQDFSSVANAGNLDTENQSARIPLCVTHANSLDI